MLVLAYERRPGRPVPAPLRPNPSCSPTASVSIDWLPVNRVCAKQLGRRLDHIRGLVLETVDQEAVAVIVVVEDSPQVLPGRQGPVPLQLGRNRRPVQTPPDLVVKLKHIDIVGVIL